MNTRKMVKVLIVLTIISFTIGGMMLKSLYQTHELNEEQTLGVEDATSIRIYAINADVNIIPSEPGVIRAVLHGTFDSSIKGNAAKLSMDKIGQNISIETKYPRIKFSFEEKEHISLDIYVPNNFTHELVLHGSSGNVKIRDLNFKYFEFTTESGNLSADNISTETKFKSESGDLILNRNRGNVSAVTGSGSIIAAYPDFQNLVDARTVSGKMILGFPEESCFDLDFKTESGKLNTYFPLKINSMSRNPDETLHGVYCYDTDVKSAGKIRFGTISGDLSIKNFTVFTDMGFIDKDSRNDFLGCKMHETDESMGVICKLI
ncbi:MAG TPA: DUF4097 family beta strand repeat-containing protein [Candidatus Methylomirabilis sp.]|nr:DUF4097 family beta strand repeat-containing protein [Candidatus Methylomirabilis sp.]